MKQEKEYPLLSTVYHAMLIEHYDADMVYRKLVQWIVNHPTSKKAEEMKKATEQIYGRPCTTDWDRLMKRHQTFKDDRIEELLEYALENSIITDKDLITTVYTILTACCKCYDFCGKAKYIFNDFSDHLEGLHYTYVYTKKVDSFRQEVVIRTGEFIVNSLEFLTMFAKDFSIDAEYVWELNKDNCEKIHKFNSYLKSHCSIF